MHQGNIRSGGIAGLCVRTVAMLRGGRALSRTLAAAGLLSYAAVAVTQATTAPRQSGTVKSSGEHAITISTAAGQDVTVNVTGSTKFLIVAPGSTDLKTATAGSMTDVSTGDRAIVNGTAGDSGATLNAVRVILMKSGAIAQAHAAESSAWTQGSGGIVKSVDPSGSIVISSGMKTLSVTTTPQTVVRRYSNGSVRFEDAVASTVSAIQPGDQLRVRGAKSADGSSITADEIVTGSFHNYSGVIASIDSSADTITLKDLATKKTVTVAVSQNSDVRRLPAQMATMVAARMRAGASAAVGAGGARPTSGAGSNGAGDAGGADAGQRRAGRAGTDLSSMLARLPTETLGGLKAGEAVMIVASSPQSGSANSTVITLLAGVEPILAAPAGESTTLSPWSLGGGGGEGDAGGGGGGATP